MSFELKDVNVIEGEVEASAEEHAVAVQRAIDSGMWGLQGSYGRMMMGAIEAGDCMLGKVCAYDYYKNYIPARNEVQPGSKGSREFVVARHGEEWAKMLEAA